MNEKELREIKRRFRPDRSNIPNIVGCFINSSGQIISRFNQSILLTENDESEELLAVMKKTLSGSLGTNLWKENPGGELAACCDRGCDCGVSLKAVPLKPRL